MMKEPPRTVFNYNENQSLNKKEKEIQKRNGLQHMH